MSIRTTFRPKIGRFRINLGRRGVSSVSTKVEGVTFRVWSPTKRAGVSSVDLPGPFSVRPRARRRR